MIDLGTVRPGQTIRIPFNTFDKDDSSSITMTNFAVADILVYKNGGTTPRASTNGFTATTDFASKTGRHLIVIDLADNSDAGFWSAGGEYLVNIDSVTVDSVVVGSWQARFRIGATSAWLDTTIATLASQTQFTLSSGPAEDDALNGMTVYLHDIASAVQWSRAVVLDYFGSTKTVYLSLAPSFTITAGDNVSIIGAAPLQPSVPGYQLAITATQLASVDIAAIYGLAAAAGYLRDLFEYKYTFATHKLDVNSEKIGNTAQSTGDLSALMSGLLTAIEGTGGIPGAGADACTTILLDDDADPIADADVWVSNDADGDNVVAGSLQTDSAGAVTFMLDAGLTYYLWMQKDGVNSIMGREFVASAD